MKKIIIIEINEVKGLLDSRLSYVFKRLRLGIIISSAAVIMFFLLAMWENGICYFAGFLSGCINFVLLDLSLSFLTKAKYKNPVLVQRLFFIVRYLIVVNILIRIVNPNAAYIILFCVGFLNVNFSVIVSSYKFKLNSR